MASWPFCSREVWEAVEADEGAETEMRELEAVCSREGGRGQERAASKVEITDWSWARTWWRVRREEMERGVRRVSGEVSGG